MLMSEVYIVNKRNQSQSITRKTQNMAHNTSNQRTHDTEGTEQYNTKTLLSIIISILFNCLYSDLISFRLKDLTKVCCAITYPE